MVAVPNFESASNCSFVVILKNTISEDAIRLIERIMVDIQEPFNIEKLELFTNFSIGISHYPTDAETPDSLLKNMEEAMRTAKENGGQNATDNGAAEQDLPT